MKIVSNRNTLGGLISQRLAELGASNIPALARGVIEADTLRACTRTVQRTITAPRVGRAVARALAEGSKGDVSPLASRQSEPKAQIAVAGSATASTGDTATGEAV